MSKNKNPLLNEGTVRRMMRLAEIDSLSDQFVGQRYVAEEEELDLDADIDVEEPAMDEPAMDEPAMDEPEGASDEVTLSDDEARAALDALKAAEPLIDKLEAALGDEEAEAEPEMELDAEEPEMELSDEPSDDLEEPGNRPDGMYEESTDSLYEAALKGLDLVVVDDTKITPERLEEVKKAIYKRVVNRLVKDSKSKK
jgi:hypothetical protein